MSAKKLNIWILNPFDDVPGEGPQQRFWALAEALVAEGCSVVWWSSNFSHRRKALRSSSSEGLSFELRLVETPPYQRNISWQRMRNHRVYGERLFIDACSAIEGGELVKPDLILASLPPMEGPMAALRLKERYGCKVVVDMMDTWPDTFLQVMPTQLHWFGRVLLNSYYRMLRAACLQADAISAQSKAFAAYAQGAGALSEPYICYLGASRAENCSVDEGDVLGAHSSLKLVYLGSMGRSYDLDTILDAMVLLEERGYHVECLFIGDGEKRASLESRNVRNVRFAGFLSGDELEMELKDADLGVVPFFESSGVAVPYKAGEYLAHGLPILSTIDGELGGLIRRYDCGAIYEEGNAESLVDALLKYRESADALKQAKIQAKECFFAHFDRSRSYPLFAQWLMRVVHA